MLPEEFKTTKTYIINCSFVVWALIAFAVGYVLDGFGGGMRWVGVYLIIEAVFRLLGKNRGM